MYQYFVCTQVWLGLIWFLWHNNHWRLLNAISKNLVQHKYTFQVQNLVQHKYTFQVQNRFHFKWFSLAYVSNLNVKTVLFQAIQFSISTQLTSIWSIDRTLSGATTQDQNGPGSDSSEGVFHIPQTSSTIGTSPSDCLVSYRCWVLPLCWEAVGVFYCPSRLGEIRPKKKRNEVRTNWREVRKWELINRSTKPIFIPLDCVRSFERQQSKICRIHRLLLCRGVRPLPMSAL